jgi:hypothetical protein
MQLEQLLKSTQKSVVNELGQLVNDSEGIPGQFALDSLDHIERLQQHRLKLQKWRQERKECSRAIKELFNPQFGSVFRTRVNPSMFADRIRAYVDL